MTAMYQGELQPMQVSNAPESRVDLPGPALQPMREVQPDRPMSDLQNMMANEQKQHQQNYMNQNGHNDHGLGL